MLKDDSDKPPSYVDFFVLFCCWSSTILQVPPKSFCESFSTDRASVSVVHLPYSQKPVTVGDINVYLYFCFNKLIQSIIVFTKDKYPWHKSNTHPHAHNTFTLASLPLLPQRRQKYCKWNPIKSTSEGEFWPKQFSAC